MSASLPRNSATSASTSPSASTAPTASPRCPTPALSESSAKTPGRGQDPEGTPQSTEPARFAANGAFTDNLIHADRDKDRGFIESITSGQFHNQIAAGVESARACMLGRKAGYTGRETTWDELEKDHESWELGIDMKQFS